MSPVSEKGSDTVHVGFHKDSFKMMSVPLLYSNGP